MAKTKAERFTAVHDTAMRDFAASQDACYDVRRQCVEDRRFATISGAQWEGPLGKQFENKPKLEVNKAHLSVLRIINEYRNNRITVDYVSKDGDEDDPLADTCDGLYRADEQDSVADEAYDNAFEEAVTGGFGAWRLRAEYEDEEDDDDDKQRIRFEPIYDADSCVFFDPDAKRQDKSDAKYCFVLTSMTRAAFEEEWPDAAVATMDKTVSDDRLDWWGPDSVYVAEYYRIEETRIPVVWMVNAVDEEEKFIDPSDELITEQEAKGSVISRTKKVKRKKVRKYLMSGAEILEDCGLIAGSCIPVIPVYGQRWFIDNIERCMGHVRLVKDAQRLKNMQMSKLAEISSFGGPSTPIFTPEQIAGHEMLWASKNTKNPAYLLVNALEDQDGNEVPTGPLGYTQEAAIPQATAALLQIIEEDIQDILGNQEAGEEIPQNVSGKAVELIQARLDMQSYLYMSNFAKAVQRCGVVWLGMASEIYTDEGRKMKTIGPQGEMEPVELMVPVQDKETGEIEYENDLSQAKMDVVADVGPSSSSRRSATVRALTGMMQITPDPETQQVLGSMAMMNMEGEGIGDVRDYFRKRLLRMGVVEPTDAEAEEMAMEQQSAQPDANQALLLAEAEKSAAEAQRAQADTEKTMAETEETRAKTAETLAGIEQDEMRIALDAAKTLSGGREIGVPPGR